MHRFPFRIPCAITFAFFVAILLFVGANNVARAATFNVCPTGCAYSTIQGAITAAASGDTIAIGAGSYTVTATMAVSKTLTFQGDGSYPQIFFNVGGGATNNIFNVTANNVIFRNLEIYSPTSTFGTRSNYAVYYSSGSGLLIDDCKFHDVRRALQVSNGTTFTVQNSELSAMNRSMIEVDGGTGPFTITRNWIHDSSYLGGSTFGISTYRDNLSGGIAEISYNYIEGARSAIAYIPSTADAPVSGSILIDHNTIDNTWASTNSYQNTNAVTPSYNTQGIAIYDPSGYGLNSAAVTIRDNIVVNTRWYGTNYDGGTTGILNGNLSVANSIYWNNYWDATSGGHFPNEWFGTAIYPQIGWEGAGAGIISPSVTTKTLDPLFIGGAKTKPSSYYALGVGSPACNTASDGQNIGAWQGTCPLPPSLIVVDPANMNGWWFVQETPTGSGSLVYGPSTPPLGIGSAQFTVDGTGGEDFGTFAFAGTPLAEITSLAYSTYRVSGASDLAPSLQFDIATAGGTGTAWQGRLVYEPYYAHTVSTGAWQTWNPLDNAGPGNWWFTGAPGNAACPISAPCTWAKVLADFPNASIRSAGPNTGATQFKAGGGWTGGFLGNVDAFSIGVNNTVTTYDFEPQPPKKFIFANVTSSAVVGNNVSFNIEAVNASGTVDTSFEQGVTLTVSGSGTGGGLVTIVNGVGTSTVSDNIAQNVVLGLQDSQSTGLDVSSTANMTFTPGPITQLVLNHPGNMNEGTRLGYTVSREDQFGNFVSASDTMAYLYTNSTSANAAFWNASTGGTQITSTTIPNGSTSTVFWYYDDTLGSRTIIASDNPVTPDGTVGIIDASDTFSVAPGAVKFVFANVPSNVTAGNGATVNVYAVDSLNNIYPSFAGGVAVTTSGSAAGSGLVNIVNGVGTTTITDATAETVMLGFRDTQNTGLGAGATAQIVFNPAPVAPPAPSAGGGGVAPSPVPFGIKPGVTITFSGMAYPGASVVVVRKDLGLQAVPVTQAVSAAADGSFLVELDNVIRLTGQTYLLSFVDKNGLIAQTKAYNIPAQDKIVYGNILAAPTLGFKNASVVSKGTPLTLTGYATPKATVELFIDGNPAGTILVNDPSGKYVYPLNTDTLGLGRHAVWAIQKYAVSAAEVSGYTNSLSQDEIFIGDATNGVLITKNASSGLYAFVPAITGGTGGGVLPVVVGQIYTKQAESDFSNQESFTVSPLANPKLDLNGDGGVDIRDLSIFLSYLKNLNADLTNFHIMNPNIVQALDFNGDGVVDMNDLNILSTAILHP